MKNLKALKILKEHKYSLDCLIRTDVVSHLLKQTNEAIVELESLENRSCEGCKYWCQEFQSVGICDKGIKEEKHWRESMTFHNFCCNKWESK